MDGQKSSLIAIEESIHDKSKLDQLQSRLQINREKTKKDRIEQNGVDGLVHELQDKSTDLERRLYDAFLRAKRQAEATSVFTRVPSEEGGRFPFTGTGDVNTYALFTEHFINTLGKGSRAGIVVPLGIATDATTAPFFAHLTERGSISSLFSFNNKVYFSDQGLNSNQFCLLTLTSNGEDDFDAGFNLSETGELDWGEKRFKLSTTQISSINPNTKTLPVFRARRDAEIVVGV